MAFQVISHGLVLLGMGLNDLDPPRIQFFIGAITDFPANQTGLP
jgi:hypothetical protein